MTSMTNNDVSHESMTEAYYEALEVAFLTITAAVEELEPPEAFRSAVMKVVARSVTSYTAQLVFIRKIALTTPPTKTQAEVHDAKDEEDVFYGRSQP